ncbi:MAG: glycoside hydrolase family 108 protein [Polaromonas sp.]|nr:glycoside hydrolase family 108 protein [Polaromonas sp.]
MNFDVAFERLLGNEGGYSNNPSDPGGATNWGVTQAVARANGYQGDMRDFTQAQAKVIYRRDYWDAVRAGALPAEVRFDIFDGAVNSGVGQSIRWLQRAVGAEADGVLGTQTLAAVGALPGAVVAARYNGHRLMFMAGLKTWPVFGGGWARRIAGNLLGVA